MADIAEEIGLHLAIGEEGFFDRALVEARHRAAIQPERARGKDQITALHRGIAKRGFFDEIRLTIKPALGIGMREELRQMLMEFRVIANDGANRGRHRLIDIARRQSGAEFFFRFFRADENDARRQCVHARRAELHQFDEALQFAIADRLIGPGILRAGIVKELTQSVIRQGRIKHEMSFGSDEKGDGRSHRLNFAHIREEVAQKILDAMLQRGR